MAENSENADYIAKCGHERYNLRRNNLGGTGGQEEKWMTEDEMAGRHQRLDGHEFE